MSNLLAFFIILSSLDINQLKELAKSSFDKAEKQYIVQVVPNNPVVEKCPCDGKGYIVQGDGHKSDCPGTSAGPCKFLKKAEPEPVKPIAKAEVQNGVIIMYSWASGCQACERWKRVMKPLFKNSGWKVEVVPVVGGSVPYFDVIMRGVPERVNEYLTIDKLNAINLKYMGAKK